MIYKLVAALLLSSATSAAADPLLFHNGRLFIRARVNEVATEALLDSGAEGTIVDPDFALKAKLPEGTPQEIKGSGGTSKARIAEGVTLEALGVRLHPDAVIILDLKDLSTRLVKRPTQVIIGRELFDSARLQIDISGGTIRVADKSSIALGKKLALTGHAGIEAIQVVVNGHPAQADFDLGNGSEVLISRDMAKTLCLKVVGKKSGGGIGGAVNRDLVRLGSLEIAGTRFHNIVAAIDDQPSRNDLNLGTAILKNFLITTDFSNRAVWLAREASAH